MAYFRISYSVLKAAFRVLEDSRQNSFKVQVPQLHVKWDLIYKHSNYNDFARTQGQETGQIPEFVAEQKTEFLCLGCQKIVPGMGGYGLGAPFKWNWTTSPSKNSARLVVGRGEPQVDVLGLVYQMSRHSLSSLHWYLNHVLEIA